jgi:hypothetical protein
MSTRLEQIDGGNWKDFLQAPVAVLMLGKSDCQACQGWTEELQQFLADDTEWKHVRFGKMLLDKGGLFEFKRATPWLAGLDTLTRSTAAARSGSRSPAAASSDSCPGSGASASPIPSQTLRSLRSGRKAARHFPDRGLDEIRSGALLDGFLRRRPPDDTA